LIKLASTPATADAIETPTASASNSVALSWTLYEVRDAPLVSSLDYLPVVESGQSKSTWLATAIDCTNIPILERTDRSHGPSKLGERSAGALVSARQSQAIAPTVVSHITTSNSSIPLTCHKLVFQSSSKCPTSPIGRQAALRAL